MMSGASASVPCLDYIPLFPCSSALSNHPSSKCHLPHFTNPTLTVYYSVTSPPFHRRLLPVLCSAADAANEANSADEPHKPDRGFWGKWKIDKAEINSKMAKLGLAAVLAYGLFDGVTYTSFFVLAFLGYEKSTGKNPAANLQALLGIVILMWTGNNVTRPFRVAGAAALAPLIDKGLKKIQKYFNFPSPVYAFAMVVASVAASCLTVVDLLILSRWGK